MNRAVATVGILLLATGATWWVVSREEKRVGTVSTAVARGAYATIVGMVVQDGRPGAARVEIRAIPGRARGMAAFGPEGLDEALGCPIPLPPPVAAVESDAEGRFEAGVPEGKAFEALAVMPDGAIGWSSVEVPAEGARTEVVIDVLPSLLTFEGRVTQADGRPWVGQVAVFPRSATTRFLHRPAVPTDANGHFAVIGLPAGMSSVVAFRPGEIAVTWRGIEVAPSREVTLALPRAEETLFGRVVDAATDAPIAGAKIVGSGGTQYGTVVRWRAAAGPDGEFAGPWSRKGARILVAAEGFAALSLEGFDASEPCEVRLARPATLGGRVLRDSDAAPVAGARVQVLTYLDQERGALLGEAISGADGRYEVAGLPPGPVQVTGRAKGLRLPSSVRKWMLDWNALVGALESGTTTERDLRFLPGAEISGVVTADGRPVPRAIVRIDGPWEARQDLGPEEVAVATDEEGAFRIDGLPPDVTFHLSVAAAARAEETVGPFTLRGGHVTPVAVALAATTPLQVIVLDDATGAPIAGARVREDARGRGAECAATTDAEGRAVLRVRAIGFHAVEAQATGRAARRGWADEGSEGPLTIRLASGRLLAGRVLLPDGSPAAGASVGLETERMPLTFVVAGDDGSFRFDGLESRRYLLRAGLYDPGGSFAAATFVMPHADIVVRLSPQVPSVEDRGAIPLPRGVVLRIVDAQGRLVPRAEAERRVGRDLQRVPVRGGRCRWPTIADDESEVSVWGAADAYGVPLPFAPTRAWVAPESSERVVRLEPESVLDGFVVGPDGSPVLDALVVASWPDRTRAALSRANLPDALATGRTGEKGYFRLGGLPRDDVVLIAISPTASAVPATLRTRQGNDAAWSRVLQLRPGVEPRVLVLDPDGKPLAGATVEVRDARTDAIQPVVLRRADAEGSAVLDRMDPTVPRRLIVRPIGRDDLVTVEHERWLPRDETIRVPRRARIRGRVVDRAGNSIPRAYVARVGRTGWTSAGTGWVLAWNGEFQIEGTEDEPLRLRVTLDGSLATAEATVLARASVSEATIPVDTGLDWRVRIDGPMGAKRSDGRVATAYVGLPAAEAVKATAILAADGVATFRGAHRDAIYSVWMHFPDEGLHVLERGLRWTEEGAETAAHPGLEITGNFRAPRDADDVSIWATCDGLVARGTLAADAASYAIRGLPPGSWTVTASCKARDGTLWRDELTVDAGAPADVVLRPDVR